MKMAQNIGNILDRKMRYAAYITRLGDMRRRESLES